MEIKGSVALVTGGNRGIGEAFGHVLLESGARKVYGGSREPGRAHLVEAYRGRGIAIELDVTDPTEVEAAARPLQRRQPPRQQRGAVRQPDAARRTGHVARAGRDGGRLLRHACHVPAFGPCWPQRRRRHRQRAVRGRIAACRTWAATALPRRPGAASPAPCALNWRAGDAGDRADRRLRRHAHGRARRGGKESPRTSRAPACERSRATSTKWTRTGWRSRCARPATRSEGAREAPGANAERSVIRTGR